MKSWTLPILSALLLPLLAGCPMESHFPIAEPDQHPLDRSLLGEWTGISTDGDSSAVTVFPFNESEYYVETRERSGAASRFRAFAFQVDGLTFLQINELQTEPGPGSYVIARLEMQQTGTASIVFVGEKLVPETLADDPKAILARIKANARREELYDAESALRLQRVER